MVTKAELITQSMLRIRIMELELEKDKDCETLKRVLEHERQLLDAVKSSD